MPPPDASVIAAALLDLLDLIDEDAADQRLAQHTGDVLVEQAIALLNPQADLTSRAAVWQQLNALGAVTSGQVNVPALRDRLRLCQHLRAELIRRSVPETSRLVITAASAEGLPELREALDIRPILHAVQDVIRAAQTSCVVGAPYWNQTAVDQLWPALEGLAKRDGCTTLICPGGAEPDGFDPRPMLRRLITDLRLAGGAAELLTYRATSDDGTDALLHGKFVLADDADCYVGSANMTAQGFGKHLELGARLGQAEASKLRELLDRLRVAEYLQPDT